MGLKIQLQTTFTDSSLPILRADPILSSGSLILVDTSHPEGYNGGNYAVLPTADGGTLENVAWKEAAAIIGSGDQTTLKMGVKNTMPTSQLKLEFSAKKGLHMMASRTQTTNAVFGLSPAAAIKTYMFANQAHSYYISVWAKQTREALHANQITGGITANVGSSEGLFRFMPGTAPMAGSPILGNLSLPASPVPINHIGNYFKNVAGRFFGTPSSVTSLDWWIIKNGNFGAFGIWEKNQTPSYVHYRTYIEDLTVSGRTYAEVSALDQKLYNAAFSVGGKFYGDTHSDPAVVLP